MKKLFLFLLLSFFYNTFCWYDWTVWVPEPVKHTINIETSNKDGKNHISSFFGPVNLENQYLESSIAASGPCSLKNVSVHGDVTVHGPLNIDGFYTKKQKDFTKTAQNIIVYGPASISNAVVDTIVTNGPLEIKNTVINEKISVKGPVDGINIQCKENIKVSGKCTLDNVTTKILHINLKKKKTVKLHNVTIDILVIKSKKPIKVYVSGDSTIKEVQFTKKIGEVIVQDQSSKVKIEQNIQDDAKNDDTNENNQ